MGHFYDPFLDPITDPLQTKLENDEYALDQRARNAIRAFGVLGPQAGDACPDLAKLVTPQHDDRTALSAMEALISIGPNGYPMLRDVLLLTKGPYQVFYTMEFTKPRSPARLPP